MKIKLSTQGVTSVTGFCQNYTTYTYIRIKIVLMEGVTDFLTNHIYTRVGLKNMCLPIYIFLRPLYTYI
jgi:hypothetical protein